MTVTVLLIVRLICPSLSIYIVVTSINDKYRAVLNESKKLYAAGLWKKAVTNHIDADTLLYDHAIAICGMASVNELFGDIMCFPRYQTAQILLHSLAQKYTNPLNKRSANKYKNACEKRLYLLQQQGIIYATHQQEEDDDEEEEEEEAVAVEQECA